MLRINRNDLKDLLESLHRAAIVSFYATTIPKLVKGKGDTACPTSLWEALRAGRLVKVAKVAGVIGASLSYTSCVNRQRG